MIMETLVREVEGIRAAARLHIMEQTMAVEIVSIMATNTLEKSIVHRRGEVRSEEEEMRALSAVPIQAAFDRSHHHRPPDTSVYVFTSRFGNASSSLHWLTMESTKELTLPLKSSSLTTPKQDQLQPQPRRESHCKMPSAAGSETVTSRGPSTPLLLSRPRKETRSIKASLPLHQRFVSNLVEQNE